MAHSRTAAEVQIYRNGVLQATGLEFLRATRTRGAEVNSAQFRIASNDSTRTPILQEIEVADIEDNDVIEVVVEVGTDPGTGDKIYEIAHYGRLCSTPVSTDGDGDVVKLESRLDHHMFGGPVDRIRIANRRADEDDKAGIAAYESAEIDDPLIFNPIRNGIAVPNQSVATLNDGTNDYYHFVDHESINAKVMRDDRIAAEDLSYIPGTNTVAEFWSLATIVDYLFKTLNPGETHVSNPTFAEITAALPVTEDEMVRDFQIPVGTFLPDALDRLLVPFGYGWAVEFTYLGSPPPISERKIILYKRGQKTPTTVLRLQKAHNVVDAHGADTVRGLDLSVDMVNGAFNYGVVLGDKEQVECSLILRPGWKPIYDGLGGTDKIAEFAEGSQNWQNDPEIRDAFRLFVANESGAYTGLRPWFAEALSLSPLFSGTTIFRRRRLLPVLSLDAHGKPLGENQSVALDYRDPDKGNDWYRVRGSNSDSPGLAEASFQILDDQIGIYFTGVLPPYDLLAWADRYGVNELYLRVTATIEGDTRVRSNNTADMSGMSKLQDEKRAIFDQRNQFAYRRIDTSQAADVGTEIGGTVLNKVTDGESDMRDAISSRALELTRKYNVVSIDGPVVVDGIDNPLTNAVGRSLKDIQSRDIKFTLNGPAGANRYPDIVRVVFDGQSHQTLVHVESAK